MSSPGIPVGWPPGTIRPQGVEFFVQALNRKLPSRHEAWALHYKQRVAELEAEVSRLGPPDISVACIEGCGYKRRYEGEGHDEEAGWTCEVCW